MVLLTQKRDNYGYSIKVNNYFKSRVQKTRGQMEYIIFFYINANVHTKQNNYCGRITIRKTKFKVELTIQVNK